MKVYTLSPSYSFASIVAPLNPYVDNWTIKVETNDMDYADVYPSSITVTLKDYPSVTEVTYPFTIKMIDPCTLTNLVT